MCKDVPKSDLSRRDAKLPTSQPATDGPDEPSSCGKRREARGAFTLCRQARMGTKAADLRGCLAWSFLGVVLWMA